MNCNARTPCPKKTKFYIAGYLGSEGVGQGYPTLSPLTQVQVRVQVAKLLDQLHQHLQNAIFERAGHLIALSTLAQ